MSAEMQELDLPDRYTPSQVVGNGRFSQVVQCHDSELDREVAIKIGELAGRSEIEQNRMKREIRISCKLRHPHIASGIDGFVRSGRVHLVLPFLPNGTMPVAEMGDADSVNHVLLRFIQVTAAVEYIHTKGIGHGDIKPENVLLDSRGLPQLTDFGSCQLLKSSDSAKTDTAVGTPAYMAPELVDGSGAVSVASDVYGLGATLFTWLCGRPPFEGDSLSILRQVIENDFPHATDHRPGLSTSLSSIIKKACARHPRQRYASAAAFAADIEAFRTNRPIQARPASVINRGLLWSRRNPLTAALAGTLTVLIVGGSAVSGFGWSRSVSQQRDLKISQMSLLVETKKALDRERELSGVLAAIESDQQKIELATAEETRLRKEAETIQKRVASQSAIASEKLADAKELATQILTLDGQTNLSSEQLKQLRKIESQRTTFLDHMKRRNAFRSELQKINPLDISNTAGKSILNIDQDLKGLASMYVRWASQQINERVSPAEFATPEGIQSLRWDRDGQQILLVGANRSALLLRQSADASQKWTEQTIDWSSSTQVPSSRIAEFSRDGKQIVMCQRVAADTTTFDIISLDSDSKQKHTWSAFRGRVHSVRFVDSDHLFALRSSEASSNDLEWVSVPENQVLWSASKDREASANNTAVDGKLLPFFIETGTDRWQHLVFASSPIPPRKGDWTPVYVHSLDLSSNDRVTVSSFDFGMVDLSSWPHQWQVSETMCLGIGRQTLHPYDPAPIANSRYAVFRDSGGVSEPAATPQVYEKSWRKIHWRTGSPIDRPELFRGHVMPRDGWARHAIDEDIKNPRIRGALRFDRMMAQFYFVNRSGRIVIQDLLSRTTAFRTRPIARLPSANRLIASSSGHQFVAIDPATTYVATLGSAADVPWAKVSEVTQRLGALRPNITPKETIIPLPR
ncbi:protein kinase domain-containing protein [Rhodopirellula europaea]|uniref:protein kinase domain-containing protein n=1 Tax=Rhodopirellula europaea TaxID=1263866 RepID=UPI003D271ABD